MSQWRNASFTLEVVSMCIQLVVCGSIIESGQKVSCSGLSPHMFIWRESFCEDWRGRTQSTKGSFFKQPQDTLELDSTSICIMGWNLCTCDKVRYFSVLRPSTTHTLLWFVLPLQKWLKMYVTWTLFDKKKSSPILLGVITFDEASWCEAF